MADRTYDVSLRLIDNRQDLLGLTETRKQGLEPYMLDRDDMYWAEVIIKDYFLEAKLTYSMDQQISGAVILWHTAFEYGPREFDTIDVRGLVRNHWDKSKEKAQAEVWIRTLIEGGYYSLGRYPGVNSGVCPYCGTTWEKGTSHPHTYMVDWNYKGEKRLIHHHRLMEKTIKERGLTKLGVSALPDIPSLEELGELEPVVIQ
jgi:hypothetical protein